MTHMLELKNVAYSYQSYSEDILSNVNYQSKMGHFTVLLASRELGNQPPLPPSWSGQSQEGAGSL